MIQPILTGKFGFVVPDEKAKPLCQCECGQPTRGGRYLPGHDARHKSALIALAHRGSRSAMAMLASRGWGKFLKAGTDAAEVVRGMVEALPKVDTYEDRLARARARADDFIPGLELSDAFAMVFFGDISFPVITQPQPQIGEAWATLSL